MTASRILKFDLDGWLIHRFFRVIPFFSYLQTPDNHYEFLAIIWRLLSSAYALTRGF